ncbi:AMP-binding protein, partial [Virgisporangium aurantiacum]|uniref:AMP-binding protein n=1 Tax=Virgisporangium aurantiacum TaxID=175570 RepID=UPI0019518E58
MGLVSVVSGVEWGGLVGLGVGPVVDGGGLGLVSGLFEGVVGRVPGGVAVVAEEGVLSFGELGGRVGRLAWLLRGLGVGGESVVGVCLPRGLDLVVAVLAVLRAGGVYLPVEVDDPVSRVGFVLGDAGAVVVISAGRWRGVVDGSGWSGPVVWMDDAGTVEALGGGVPVAAPVEVWGESLAYVLYTSGSTGVPKGVLGRHAGLANRLAWMGSGQGVGSGDRFLLKTPISFDVSLWELLCPLTIGATLVVARPGGHRDPGYLAGLMAREGVTVVHFVPSMLRAFLAVVDGPVGGGLRRLVCSGEVLPGPVAAAAVERLGVVVDNLYGPTEAAIDATAATDLATDPVTDPAGWVPSIGVPIANVRVYVV